MKENFTQCSFLFFSTIDSQNRSACFAGHTLDFPKGFYSNRGYMQYESAHTGTYNPIVSKIQSYESQEFF